MFVANTPASYKQASSCGFGVREDKDSRATPSHGGGVGEQEGGRK